jgi:hypothetical protein
METDLIERTYLVEISMSAGTLVGLPEGALR